MAAQAQARRTFRSLHMKLVLIMVLLIVALMSVVGTFLISSVVLFSQNEFSARMADAFSNNTQFVESLRAAAADGPERLRSVLRAYADILGVSVGEREYYVLDGQTGAFLAGSDEAQGLKLELTPNIYTALAGSPGYARRVTDSYMDCAVPISGGDGAYIVYIRDNKSSLQRLTTELFLLILEAVLFGLAISILLSFLLSKTMTTPLENLTMSASLMAKGDFDHMLEVHSGDEIGVLTSSFNDMAQVLKETLTAVERERDKLGTLFLHMTDGVTAFDRGGKLIHFNPAARRMLGRRFRENGVFADFFGETADFDELLSLSQPRFWEKEISLAGRSLKLYMAPFGGADPGVMVVIHDETEQRRLEAVRREFVSNVSHELRTPLTNIKSYAETIQESGDLPPETVRDFSAVIVGEADRMTRIVSDLLTLSRFDYGKMDWQISRFSFEDMLKNVYEAMLLEARRRGHDVSLEFVSLPLEITGDRERIEQVVVNILSNAMKYTPDGGVIELTAGAGAAGDSPAGPEDNEDFVWVRVKDNGIGVPPEDIPRLFERFYRVDKARARASGGTGLGLAIAREIVEHHKGRIDFESAPGQGTTVTVALPETFSV